jgi:hypothetical protein
MPFGTLRIAKSLCTIKNKNMSELTVTEQFTKTLFLDDTLDKVKNQFESSTEIQPVDEFDMNFRLLLVGNTINLELLASGPLGHYFKPIGFYDRQMNIYVLKEFETDIEELKSKGELINDSSIKTLSLRENAVIAAFSMDVIVTALQVLNEVKEKGFEPEFRNGMMIPANLRYDKRLMVNGLNSELIMTFEGYPQFNLDDDYGLNGAIGAYMPSEQGLSINPIVEYKELFDKFAQMKLLSAYNRI